ncbi:MAG: hypothetical protein Q8O24_10135 [Gallionellaceae bacterium]|nr:hypothetical protein [Gallionellaceae bacterium]
MLRANSLNLLDAHHFKCRLLLGVATFHPARSFCTWLKLPLVKELTKMRTSILFFIFLLLSLGASATTLNAEARASSKELAQRQALADLANSIFVNVQSESFSLVEGSGKRKDELRIKSSSDIPLIGADIKCSEVGREVLCKVSLDSAKSLVLYAQKIKEQLNEINELHFRIAKASGNDRYLLLTQALTVIEQYEKYRAVAQLLGDATFTAPTRTRSDTEAQLRELEKSSPSMQLAAQVLSKGLKAEAVYIYPAVPQGSHEVTAFGRVMRDRLAEKLNGVDSPDKAQTIFKGEYEILSNGLHLTYRLLDTSGNTLETRVAMLAPAAYKDLQTQPTTMNFDRLLHEGVAVSGDFKAQLTTNRGSADVLFNEKEEVELLVKLNRSGYFYVVGHVAKKGENYSYLLEMSEAENARRFIRYVNADDANKWLSIGKFEISAPFGVESVQLMASSDDPISRLPVHQLDKKSELYLTSSNAEQGITKTRALKPKRSETDKQYQGEAVLMFTTMTKGR